MLKLKKQNSERRTWVITNTFFEQRTTAKMTTIESNYVFKVRKQEKMIQRIRIIKADYNTTGHLTVASPKI